jgi:hypothetical protein
MILNCVIGLPSVVICSNRVTPYGNAHLLCHSSDEATNQSDTFKIVIIPATLRDRTRMTCRIYPRIPTANRKSHPPDDVFVSISYQRNVVLHL